MSLTDEAIQRDLTEAATANAEMSLATHEYHLACQNGQWDRAETARVRAMAFMEAHLDALMRACRRTWELTRRGA